jgi:hypothetical protein
MLALYTIACPPFHRLSLSLSKMTVPPYPPPDFDPLPSVGAHCGVHLSTSNTTWDSHPRSSDGASPGDIGTGTSHTSVHFILAQPSKDWEHRVIIN